MGDPKRFAGGSREEFAGNCFSRCKRDGVHQPIKSIGPMLGQCLIQLVNFSVFGNIAGQGDRRTKIGGEPRDSFLKPLILIRECQFSPLAVADFCDSVGD